VKVRPNGFPKDPNFSHETTIANIGEALRELGAYGAGYGVEIWLEVHGRETQDPPVAAAIMKATRHENVGLCWNSNPTDVVDGSVKQTFGMLGSFIRSCHINDLYSGYPYKEFFRLLRESGLVTSERRASWVYYRLVPEALTGLSDLLDATDARAGGVTP